MDGVNIAQRDELVRIAVTAELAADEAQTVLAERSYAAAVDADWQRPSDLRITAVPAHLFGGKRLIGFTGYEDYVKLIGNPAAP